MAGMKIGGGVSKAKKKLRGSGRIKETALERAIEEETKDILDPEEAFKREQELRNLFYTARKKTKGMKSGVLMGMFGNELGQIIANKFAKEDPEKVKSAQEFFKKYQKPKKEKVEEDIRGSQLKGIEKLIGSTKEESDQEKKEEKLKLKEDFYFDPKLGAKGGIRNIKTGRVASREQAIDTRVSAAPPPEKKPEDRLGAAISADEQPLVLLREKFEELLKNVGVDPTGKSIHEKLDELNDKVDTMEGGGGLGLTDLIPGKNALKKVLRSGKNLVKGGANLVKGGLNVAKTAVSGISGTAALAAGGAAAATAAIGIAIDRGMKKIGGEAKDKMDTLESKYGLKTLYDKKGFATGYAVGGKKYQLNELPQEYKDLIEAFGPGDKRSASARAAIKKIKDNPEKYKALEVGARKPVEAGVGGKLPAVSEGTTPIATAPPPGSVTPAKPPSPPAAPPATVTSSVAPPVGKPPTGLAAAAQAAKTPAPSASSASSTSPAVASSAAQSTSVPNLFDGKVPALSAVTTKAPGVDTEGVNKGLQDRVAKMGEAFQEVTGKKLMITSGYRSEQKQMELWNKKYAEIKAANPNDTEAQLMKKTRKWVALPAALGGKGSAHGRGTAFDINSKGSAGIDAIDGQIFNGQQVSTDSFLAMFGLRRPLDHEPWHIQPLETTPLPDNPDPNAKPMVADAKGNMVNLETGQAEAPPKVPQEAPAAAAAALPAVSESSPEAASAATEDAKVAQEAHEQAMAASESSMLAAAPQSPAMQEMVAPVSAPTPTLSAASAAESQSMVAATTPELGKMTPVQSSLGPAATAESVSLEKNKVEMQAAAPPLVVNNTGGGASQQPIQPPKQNMPKASTRSTENSFNRALARDFSHPSAFTSVGPV